MLAQKEAKVVAAAQQVFLRYGYRRATMGDIAEAAGISRPALYLVFPSKEEIFIAALTKLLADSLDEIRAGLRHFATLREKLTFAFDVWYVRPFELTQTQPDAKDLLETSYEFGAAAMATATEEFVGVLVQILEPVVERQRTVDLSAVQIARILAGAVPGFKNSSNTAADMRTSIAGLLTLVLTGIGAGYLLNQSQGGIRGRDAIGS